MVQYVINPWRNPGELLHVRQQLYPGQIKNDEGRRQAVALVSVWMQRGNCPHLVESSAILTSAILNDVPGNSTYCVRAAYSAAFCRSVVADIFFLCFEVSGILACGSLVFISLTR